MSGPALLPRELSYDEWMTAAEEEYARLLRLLRGLDAVRWRADTDCVGWDVHAMVAHLTGAAASTASVRELGRQAWLARRLGRAGDLVDRMNRIQVQERGDRTPAQLVDELAGHARRGIAARRRIPTPVLGIRLPFGPPLGTRPLGYLMGRIYTRDAWMHRVDLAGATGADLELTASHDGALVADLVAEWAAVHGRAVDLCLEGPAGGQWHLEGSGTPVELSLDAVAFAKALSGRAPGRDLLAVPVPF